jgi:hypothetical protein
MRWRATSPVQPVSFSAALNISLNNYYDLLKAQVGGLAANEFLQLKLVADPVNISGKDVSQRGYPWWSYWNLLVRSDLSIVPSPLSDQVQVSAAKLVEVYGDFLNVLIRYVAYANLSAEDQKELADIEMTVKSLETDNGKLAADDIKRWHDYADIMGYSYGDRNQYLIWEETNGNLDDMQSNNDTIKQNRLRKKIILAKHYPDPEDQQIATASTDFDNALMEIGYPLMPDYRYSDGGQFTLNYLSTQAGNPLFDTRRILSWNQTLGYIISTTAGGFTATFDRKTSQSSSITQDWGASGNVSYFFINVNANAGEHTQIQEDFNTSTAIDLAATAAFRVNILYPAWFHPTLFNCKHVKDNPKDFEVFFGDAGTLLYYPTALMLVRGFSVKFNNTQSWTYDYQHHFSASGGGGFNAFGINFGSSANYTEDTKEHQVDHSTTTLTFSDDVNTIRFIGYAVAKNTVYSSDRQQALRQALGDTIFNSLNARPPTPHQQSRPRLARRPAHRA